MFAAGRRSAGSCCRCRASCMLMMMVVMIVGWRPLTPMLPTAAVWRMMPAARTCTAAAATPTIRLVLRAQQVIQNVHNCGNIPFGLAVGVLQRRVQRAREGAAVHTLAVMVHGFNDSTPAATAATRARAALTGAAMAAWRAGGVLVAAVMVVVGVMAAGRWWCGVSALPAFLLNKIKLFSWGSFRIKFGGH